SSSDARYLMWLRYARGSIWRGSAYRCTAHAAASTTAADLDTFIAKHLIYYDPISRRQRRRRHALEPARPKRHRPGADRRFRAVVAIERDIRAEQPAGAERDGLTEHRRRRAQR